MTVAPVSTAGEGFRLADAPMPGDAASIVSGQVDAAVDADADLAIWPELTMPGDRLRLLVERLTTLPLRTGRIPLVVAGSWHVATSAFEVGCTDAPDDGVAVEAGCFVNRSQVMLGDGEPLLAYDKRRRFPFQGRTEDIRAGRSLPVIVMEDRLIGIAICRDNCDDTAKEGYGVLPLDLIIVPSMGAGSTVDAHERHAKGQRSRQGSITVVVQQNLAVEGAPAPPGPSAFSFVRPVDGKRPPLGQTEAFRTLDRMGDD